MLHYVALIIGIVFNAVANILIKAAMRNVEMGNGLVQTAMSMAFQPLLIVWIGCFVIALGGYSFSLTRIDLSITHDDWPRLIQLFREFGEGEQLSFRNSGRDEFGARRVLALSLCNELGANIEAGQGR